VSQSQSPRRLKFSSSKLPPPGLPRRFSGLCTTSQFPAPISAYAAKPPGQAPGQARWRLPNLELLKFEVPDPIGAFRIARSP
jgi:hypothetical protein